ncbi:hypothetical protein EV426DRAFT_717588 [Tirmania nivea]|nr:hypothetical protein EV426DRAFT_717588 [Tirmania nivea]
MYCPITVYVINWKYPTLLSIGIQFQRFFAATLELSILTSNIKDCQLKNLQRTRSTPIAGDDSNPKQTTESKEMGDPLSIAASVAGLITISAQIVGIAKDLFDKVKDTPESMLWVKEEVESMQPIFCQVHLLLHGSGSRLNHSNLTMISIDNLMATLTGCVIVYSRLEKKVNEVCGFDDPTTASAAWKRAAVIADRVKWGLWRHEEVSCFIEDLQRQKLSLNLMITIISCTTTTEASEVQARLQAHTTEILQSSHAHSVLLRDLISRQDEQAQALEDIRSYMSTFGGTGGTAISTYSSSASSRPSDSSDNASIISKRSTLSLRFGRPTYIEDLKASRAYKRLRHFGLGADASSDSVLSFDSAYSVGNWSMLSDITLGNLSVSAIAVLNLPIGLADISNPEPFQGLSSTDTHSRPTPHRKRSSRGRIHNAIENGNEFVVRTLLAMGMDVEELDSHGRTPLIHATMKFQEAICKLLLEKGASVEALKAFTSGMDHKKKFEFLNASIKQAQDYCLRSVTVVGLLVLMALGTNNAGDDTIYLLSQIDVLIACLNFCLKVCAIFQQADTGSRTRFAQITQLVFGADRGFIEDMGILVLLTDHMTLSLRELRDAEGWTPLASAAFNNYKALCEFLLEKGWSLCLDTEQKKELDLKRANCINVAMRSGHTTALQLLLDIGADINKRNSAGKTALLEAV